MSAKCSSCGADILWIKTMTGKAMPLNAKPEKRVVLLTNDVTGLQRGDVRDTYVSHFASCPQADAFRKKGDGK